MSLTDVFEISSQGMTAQRERIEAQSANLANANTTRTADGGPYRRRDVIFESTGLAEPSSSFGYQLASWSDEPAAQVGVRATTYVAQMDRGVRQYQPGHPDADGDGYVTMPDVDPIEETVNILSAARSFEANATAFNTAKEMLRSSISLGNS